ncbi:MAG: hypothetical protein GY714_26925, partial [Desulfobacterales bacterium]|nr:hypothetical protein [Desulfobacterales bacterium]
MKETEEEYSKEMSSAEEGSAWFTLRGISHKLKSHFESSYGELSSDDEETEDERKTKETPFLAMINEGIKEWPENFPTIGTEIEFLKIAPKGKSCGKEWW